MEFGDRMTKNEERHTNHCEWEEKDIAPFAAVRSMVSSGKNRFV